MPTSDSDSERNDSQGADPDVQSDAESDDFELLISDPSTNSTSLHDVNPNSTLHQFEQDAQSGVVPSDNQTENDTHHEPHSITSAVDKGQPEKEAESANVPKPNAKTAEARERKRQSRKRARQNAARRQRGNTSVYVSGIPHDSDEKELATHFAKCGIILPNPSTGRPRIKLYTNPSDGSFKGDALVTYALRPSVDNALTLLDGAPLRPPEYPLSVQEASFDHKQNQSLPADENAKRKKTETVETANGSNASEKPKPIIRTRDLIEEALAWDDDLSQRRSNTPKISILKNVFDPKVATKEDYDLIRQDMNEGCSECGLVEKVTIFERNEQGAVAIKFSTIEAALRCVELMNHRWYDGRELRAEFYDGSTDYRYKETEEDKEERDRKWQEWLEGTGDQDNGNGPER